MCTSKISFDSGNRERSMLDNGHHRRFNRADLIHFDDTLDMIHLSDLTIAAVQ